MLAVGRGVRQQSPGLRVGRNRSMAVTVGQGVLSLLEQRESPVRTPCECGSASDCH